MNHFETIHGLAYVTLAGMQEAAGIAAECTKTIRQWLPVKGAETLSSESTMDRWHDAACRRCFEFFKFHPMPGCYATVGPESAGANWRELCEGMADIRSHYKWEAVDFENQIPHSNVRGGKKLKPIQGRLLDRVEQAVAGLGSPASTTDYIKLDKQRVRELYGKATGRDRFEETWLRNQLKDNLLPCCDVTNKTLRLCPIEYERLLAAEAIFDRRKRK